MHGASDDEDPVDEYILRKAAKRRKLAPGPDAPRQPAAMSRSTATPAANDCLDSTSSKAQAIAPQTFKPVKPQTGWGHPAAQKSDGLPTGVIIVDGAESPSDLAVKQLLRLPRYFDTLSDQSSLICFICGSVGHLARDCTEERQRPCFLCAGFGHESWDCPNRFCFRCGHKGHMQRDCQQASAKSKEYVCLRCGRWDCSCSGSGDYYRFEVGCTSEYLETDLQHIRCFVCFQLGHLCCKPSPQEPAVLSCYNCGARGHAGEDCKRGLAPAMYAERRQGHAATPGRNRERERDREQLRAHSAPPRHGPRSDTPRRGRDRRVDRGGAKHQGQHSGGKNAGRSRQSARDGRR